MKVWKYIATDYMDDSEQLSSQSFDGGYVIAKTFDEAYQKIKQNLKEAWGNTKEVRLEITSLTFEHTIQIP